MKARNTCRSFWYAVVYCYLLLRSASAQLQPGFADPTESVLYCPSPVHLDNDRGTFSTPLYPQKYPSDEHCVWEISVDSSRVVQLKFHTFDLESDDLCGFDRVTVYEGTGALHHKIGTFCGSDVPPLLNSSGNSMTVSFRSDSIGRYGGFSAEYTAVERETANCSEGHYQCSGGACIRFHQRCDGSVDCPDESDERDCGCRPMKRSSACADILGYQQISLPNMFSHHQLSDIDVMLKSVVLGSRNCSHPQLRVFVCAMAAPRCHMSRQQLPCRSFCEEVYDQCKDGWRLPTCEELPDRDCWNVKPTTRHGEDCYHGRGINYRGESNTTVSGARCKRWSEQRSIRPWDYTWANLEENYCRNPAVDLGEFTEPFCVTQNGLEECDIFPCARHDQGCEDPGEPAFGTRKPAKRFYKLGERITFVCHRGYRPVSEHTSAICERTGNNGTRWSKEKPKCEVDSRQKLIDDILSDNMLGHGDKFHPPGEVDIQFRANVQKIVDMDEKKEQIVTSAVVQFSWNDRKVMWNPRSYRPEITELYVDSHEVWTPILTLSGDAHEDSRYQMPRSAVRISSDGRVTWEVNMLVRSSCTLDPFYFPKDTMECDMCWKPSEKEEHIVCSAAGSTDNDTAFLDCNGSSLTETGEWEVDISLQVQDKKGGCLLFHLKRGHVYHFAVVVIPCVVLAMLMIITFMIPIDKGDRISFGVTIILSMVVYLVLITDHLPVKGTLPSLAQWIILSMTMMGFFLMVTAVIMNIHGTDGDLPPRVRTFFLVFLARMLLMGNLFKGLERYRIESRKGSMYKKHGGGRHSYPFTRTEEHKRKIQRAEKNVQPDPAASKTGDAISASLELQKSINDLSFNIEMLRSGIAMIKATDQGPEEDITQHTMLARVLDRMCIVLYVIILAGSVPFILHHR
ncbi:MFRP [Branchiostoma lanceolatum]|nr:MFRP [Branchiostoma lanceolatum]